MDRSVKINRNQLERVVMIKLKGLEEVVKVDSKVALKVANHLWERKNQTIVTKGEDIEHSLLEVALDSKYSLDLSQREPGDDYTKKNICIHMGDIEYDQEMDGYWSCGMLYENIDSAVYVYQSYLEKKKHKSQQEGKKETILDYVEKKQSQEERVVFIKE